jgi:glycerol-3-phosphate dehydrogenase
VSDAERVWCIGVTASADRGALVRVKGNVAANDDESGSGEAVIKPESDRNGRLLERERVLVFNTTGEWTDVDLGDDETDNKKLLDFVRDAEAVVVVECDTTLVTRKL